MKPQSIRARLTRTILAVFFVAVALGIGGIYASFRLALISQFNKGLQANTISIITRVMQSNSGGNPDFGTQLAILDEGDGRLGLFELRKLDGTVLARSRFLKGHDLPRPTDSSWPDSWPQSRNATLSDGRDVMIIDRPVRSPQGQQQVMAAMQKRALMMPGGEREGAVLTLGDLPPDTMQLSVALDRGELDALLTRLALICGATVILLSAAALLIPPMLRHQLRPLDQMAEQTRAIDAQSLATRLPTVDLPAELQPIANYLNELFARLELSFERERRVTADLAHELRTPLAELRTWTEAALKWPQSRDPATDREIMGAAKHMEAIVTRMLALARSEGGTISLAIEQIEIPALLEHAWRNFEPLARAKNLRVDWSLNSVHCETDSALLRSILTNLFDNAVEYTPENGQVRIACDDENGHAAIRISNTATNLDRRDVARFFERFWRKEEARSGGQHVGLGLSIAQSFAQAIGWQLAATLENGNVVTFMLTSAPA